MSLSIGDTLKTHPIQREFSAPINSADSEIENPVPLQERKFSDLYEELACMSSECHVLEKFLRKHAKTGIINYPLVEDRQQIHMRLQQAILQKRQSLKVNQTAQSNFWKIMKEVRFRDGAKEVHKELRKRIARGADVNLCNQGGDLPLQCCGEDLDTLGILLKAGANPLGIDARGNNSFFYAKSIPIFELLFSCVSLKMGPFEILRLSNRQGETILYTYLSSTRNPQENIIRYLVKKGADPNAENGSKRKTSLHACANWFECSSHIISTLVDLGADINRPDASDTTPIQEAFLWDNVETALKLQKEGAKLNEKDSARLDKLVYYHFKPLLLPKLKGPLKDWD